MQLTVDFWHILVVYDNENDDFSLVLCSILLCCVFVCVCMTC